MPLCCPGTDAGKLRGDLEQLSGLPACLAQGNHLWLWSWSAC